MSNLRVRLSLAVVAAALGAFLAPVSVATAAPTVTEVSPLKTKVGEVLRVKGAGYRSGANRNTVIFMSDRGPTVFVKATRQPRGGCRSCSRPSSRRG